MRRLSLILFPLWLSGLAKAADSNAYDYESISITSSTAVGFTAAKLSPSNGPKPTSAFVTVETNDVRWRVDGTAPTTTEGHQFKTTSAGMTISGYENLLRFKAIGESGTGTLRVTYER